MGFRDLKNKTNNLETLLSSIEKMSTKSSYDDDRLWKLSTDKTGKGYAVIRFLPTPENNELPFVKVFSHNFKGDNGWFIQNCPTTIGEQCPCCEDNKQFFKDGASEDTKNIGRKRKRKTNYYTNILVIDDPSNPENNGHRFLFKYGEKLQSMILAAMKPEFEDEDAIDPFDMWKGANFRLKSMKKDGYINYDNSSFAAASAISNDDDVLEKIYESEYDLREFTSPENFRSFDELKKMHSKAIGKNILSSKIATDFDEYEDEIPLPESKGVSSSNDEEEDVLSYFQKLANT